MLEDDYDEILDSEKDELKKNRFVTEKLPMTTMSMMPMKTVRKFHDYYHTVAVKKFHEHSTLCKPKCAICQGGVIRVNALKLGLTFRLFYPNKIITI